MSTKKNVVCHANGERCNGCEHYWGKADVCKYARTEVNAPKAIRTPEQMIEAQRNAYNLLHASDKDHLLTPDALAALLRERDELKAYADKLADGLPCLPKDVEVLRQANLDFSVQNTDLIKQRDQWRECAEALAESLRDLHDRSNALARFDALKAQEAGK